MFGPAPNATLFMLSEGAIFALQNIRDNIVLARQFVAGLTFEQFEASRLHFYATARALEIISEASRRLPMSCVKGIPICPGRRFGTSAISFGTNMTMWRSHMVGRRFTNNLRRCWPPLSRKSRRPNASRDSDRARRDLPLHDRLLKLRSSHDANTPGEPKRARQWLAELLT